MFTRAGPCLPCAPSAMPTKLERHTPHDLPTPSHMEPQWSMCYLAGSCHAEHTHACAGRMRVRYVSAPDAARHPALWWGHGNVLMQRGCPYPKLDCMAMAYVIVVMVHVHVHLSASLLCCAHMCAHARWSKDVYYYSTGQDGFEHVAYILSLLPIFASMLCCYLCLLLSAHYCS